MLTIQNCMLNRVGLRLLSGERNEPPQPEFLWSPIRFKNDWCGGLGPVGAIAVRRVPVGRARLKIVLVTFGANCNLRFSGTFFSRTFPTSTTFTFTTDLRVRSSSTANTRTHESVRSRVGQIVTARATRSAARRNLRHSPRTFARRTRVRAALTSCGQRARASPVSRRYLAVSHRYLTGISSFLSPSGSRCTAAGARSHSPCGP